MRIVVTALAACLAAGVLVVGVTGDLLGEDKPLTSSREALNRITAYTDLKQLPSLKDRTFEERSTHVVSHVDTTTPFLAESFSGRVWQLDLADVVLDYKAASDSLCASYPKRLTVTVDSATGRAIQAVLVEESLTAEDEFCVPGTDDATRSMSRSLTEFYVGIPEEPPTIPLFAVLSDAGLLGLRAKYTSVVYVLHTSQLTPDTAAAWAIQVHGIYPETGEELRNWRSVIDATTGAVRMQVNIPRCSE